MLKVTTGRVGWAALVAVMAVSTAGIELAAQETVRLEGDRVAIWNLAGRIDVVRGAGPDVRVRVSRNGADGDRLQLRTGELGGRSTLRVIFPADRVVYDRGGRGSWNSTVRVREDGTFGGDGGERVRISGSGRGLEAWADLVLEVPPDRDVTVHVAIGEIDARGVEADLFLEAGSGEVRVDGVRGVLGVDTGSGSVTVRDVVGAVDVDTGSGSIRVDGLRGDRIRLDTGSGSVRGGGIAAPSLLVDTGSGEVALAAVESPSVRVDTGSGSVELELLADVERLEVDTGSGGVRVSLPSSTGADIEVDTGSGTIDLGFPVEVTSMRRDHVEGRIGDGSGRIRIDTGSGSVRLIRR